MDQLGYLKGMLGFSIANEPDLVGRMRRKYGNEIVDGVLKARLFLGDAIYAKGG